MAALTKKQLEDFHERGFLKLEHVFTREEVDAWEAESRRLLKLGFNHDDHSRVITYRTPPGLTIVDRINPIIDISQVFNSLVREERILFPLRDLYDDEMILFKDKIIYKMPGVAGYEMHQDYSLWQRFPLDLANVVISIDGANAENGGVEFFPGYHHSLLSTAGDSRYLNIEEASQIDLTTGEVLTLNPGDLVFFDCLTPHRSGINRSNRLRRQLYLTYSSARNGDLYEAQLLYMAELNRAKFPQKESS